MYNTNSKWAGGNMELYRGDCLELIKNIPDGSIDLVLTDPPYGTMKGAKLDGWKNGIQWDDALDPFCILSASSKILRPNGKAIFFSQEPYTSRLINSAPKSLPFSYRAIWYKNNHANSLIAKKAMVNRFEDICIFGKKYDAECTNGLRGYFKKVLSFIGFDSCKEVNKVLGHRKAEHCFYVSGVGNGSSQFSLCTEKTYREIVEKFHIERMEGFKTYEELTRLNKKYLPVFNLWQGGRKKSNVLEYAKETTRYHPTQKPVALLEDLIKTFSNPGETILDFTMGSGSTGVSCVRTGRKFIGIELDSGYYNTAKERIEREVQQWRDRQSQ